MKKPELAAEVSEHQKTEKDQMLIVKNYVYGLLKEEKLKIGDRLPSEKTLSEQLNVSKNAVRDALQSLKTAGLLSSVRGSGYRLTPDFDYSMADIMHAMVVYSSSSRRDIREVREALEIKELDLLIGMDSRDELLKKLEKQVDIIMSWHGKPLETDEDAEKLVLADIEFHRLLADGSSNLFIRAFNIALNEYHGGGKNIKKEAIQQRISDELLDTHKMILEAVQEADLKKGTAAIREHYALGDRVTETKEADPVLQLTISELQKRGFSREQIMDKLMELK